MAPVVETRPFASLIERPALAAKLSRNSDTSLVAAAPNTVLNFEPVSSMEAPRSKTFFAPHAIPAMTPAATAAFLPMFFKAVPSFNVPARKPFIRFWAFSISRVNALVVAFRMTLSCEMIISYRPFCIRCSTLALMSACSCCSALMRPRAIHSANSLLLIRS